MNVLELRERKLAGRRISMITCYDAWSARLLNNAQVDMLLVGDSAAMVMHGHPDTLAADVDMMAAHVRAVRSGAPAKFIVGDLPFLSFRLAFSDSVRSAAALMKAGAHAVKLEGCKGNEKLIAHLCESGVPVMGHLGLTPQSIHQLGGFRVQGRGKAAATAILEQALGLEKAGCFSIVLECVPSALARRITQKLSIPVIGIGSGPDCDGQVLVLQDMLGLNAGFKPKFLRRYLDGAKLVTEAVDRYHRDVLAGRFPDKEESY
ncbi:MAG: 3-methyl-2-oxobutanoate hydroxymethyltransferase [Elusimicrobiota bacterium]|jgi:3-methyl-2-oxobutanoate hydroxymethyltransferase